MKGVGVRVRRWDQRDLERWCLRIVTAVVTVGSSEGDGGGGDVAAEEKWRILVGEMKKMRFDTLSAIDEGLK